jgi:hypothetical protein
MKTIIKIAMLVLTLSSMSAQAEIPVLSIDDFGNETTTMISESDYENTMSAEAETSAKIAEEQVEMAMMSPHLTLKGIQIGLEAVGSIGPGPLKLGAGINQQFYFEIKR